MSEESMYKEWGKFDSYKLNEEFFSKEGFTLSVAKRFLPIAVLFAWDPYHLFYYAKRIPRGGTYLELGSYWGGSLLCAYEATRVSDRHIYVNFIAVEPIVTEQLLRNTDCIPNLRFIKSTSDVAKNQIEKSSIDLLFIDGDHTYEQCKRDIENYWPKIKNGGVLLGHDYQHTPHPGVKRAADEVFDKDKLTLLKNSSTFMVKK